MRTPKNTGTARKPRYGGVPQRYKASDGSTHDAWVGGWYSSMEAYRAAYREKCEEIERELEREAATSVGNAAAVTIKQYATEHWLRMHPRGKESTNRKYAGAPKRDEHGRPITPEIREAGDIKPIWEKWGDKTFAEVDFFAVRSWSVDQPSRVIEAGRAMWGDATTDLQLQCSNPFARAKRRKSRGRGGERITVLTDSEVDLLCDCALEAWPGPVGYSVRGVIRFLAETGVRPGECFATEHSWLLPEQKRARIFPWVRDLKSGEVLGKTSSASRRIYVSDAAWEAIAEVPKLHDLFVFTAPRGGPFTQSLWDRYWGRTRALFMERLHESHHLHQRVRRCVEAGINPAQAPEGQGNFVTYELRHYACTRWLNLGHARGQDLARMVAIQLGHKDGDPSLVYQTYGHPDQDLALNMLQEVDAEQAASNVARLDLKRQQRAR